MSTAVAKNGFKEKAKDTGGKIKAKVKETSGKIKEKVKDTGRKAKTWAKNYRDDIDGSYCKGYERGFEDALHIPDRVGAALAAGVGYREGVSKSHKKTRAEKKYAKAKMKAQEK